MDCVRVEDCPNFFSKVRTGFKNFLEAFEMKKYGPKEWGIWTLSSLASDAKYVVAAVAFYLWGILPLFVTNFLKAVFVKLTLLAAALWHVTFG